MSPRVIPWPLLCLVVGILGISAVSVRAQVGDGLFTAVDSADVSTRAAPEPPGAVAGDMTTLRSRSVRIDMEGLAAAQATVAGTRRGTPPHPWC